MIERQLMLVNISGRVQGMSGIFQASGEPTFLVVLDARLPLYASKSTA